MNELTSVHRWGWLKKLCCNIYIYSLNNFSVLKNLQNDYSSYEKNLLNNEN